MKRTWILMLIVLFAIAGCGKKEDKFAAKNQEKAGIPEISALSQTTESGLMIQEIKEGSGKEAQTGNYVTVHYSGWLPDGKLFDSSVKRNKPFTVKLGTGQVIQGWEEGIQGMKVGGKRRLTIPPEIAYGAEGYPGAIPPNATLVFDIELLSVR